MFFDYTNESIKYEPTINKTRALAIKISWKYTNDFVTKVVPLNPSKSKLPHAINGIEDESENAEYVASSHHYKV